MIDLGQQLLSRINDFAIASIHRAEDAQRKELIRVHTRKRDEIAWQQTVREGIPPYHETYANTPDKTILEEVRLPGPLVTRFDYRHEVAQVALRMLRSGGPEGKTTYFDRNGNPHKARANPRPYARSHKVFLNGQEVLRLPRKLAPADVIMIVNDKPYARRLEVGKREDGSAFTLVATDREWYQQIAERLRMRYSSIVKITRTFVRLPGAPRVRTGRLSETYRALQYGSPVWRKRRQHLGEAITHPALKIEAIPQL